MTHPLEELITEAAKPNSSMNVEKRRRVFEEFRDALERGEIRAAECEHGEWRVHAFVKLGILLGFRLGSLERIGAPTALGTFFDKDTYPPHHFSKEDGVRIVPGGTSVRKGAYIAKGVTIMPPAFVNVGAYVDTDSMIDSHALVGSCAQIGKRVHISAAAQIGGVLEPVGALPVIIEDDVLIGGNCGVYEGVVVRKSAVLASGTILNASTVVYDLVKSQVIRCTPECPLQIPERAVVIPGMRMAKGVFAKEHSLGIQTPLIVKYRDFHTDARTALEGALRDVIE